MDIKIIIEASVECEDADLEVVLGEIDRELSGFEIYPYGGGTAVVYSAKSRIAKTADAHTVDCDPGNPDKCVGHE